MCGKPNTYSCTSNSECQSGICSYGVCCGSGTCGWGAEAPPQCKSGGAHGNLCIANGGTHSNIYASGICRNGTWKVVLNGWGCSGTGWACDQGCCDSSDNTCKEGYAATILLGGPPSCVGAVLAMGLKKQISSIPDNNHVDVYLGASRVTTSYDFTPTPENDYNQAAYAECVQSTGGQ